MIDEPFKDRELNMISAPYWNARGGDDRHTSLAELHDALAERWGRTRSDIVDFGRLDVLANEAGHLELRAPFSEESISLSHWSFAQLCRALNAPLSFLRRLPPDLAHQCLQHCLKSRGGQLRMVTEEELIGGNRVRRLRAIIGPRQRFYKEYRAVPDHVIVKIVMNIVKKGIGEANWRPPCELRKWISVKGLPIDIPERPLDESTALYTSDRYVFLFLVDVDNEIVIGDEIYLRGFYCWNSEVGARSLGVGFFYFRALCENRQLWELEELHEIVFKYDDIHIERLENKFLTALLKFTMKPPKFFVKFIERAKSHVVATNDAERREFIAALGLARNASAIIKAVRREEHKDPETIFDFIQGITAVARTIPQQDKRLLLEGKTRNLLGIGHEFNIL